MALLGLVALLGSSCATTRDMFEVAARTDAKLGEVVATVQAERDGLLTPEEAEVLLQQQRGELEDIWVEKAKEIESRTSAAVDAVANFPLPSTPGGWLRLVGILTGTGVAVNTHRDRRRRARGERYGPPEPVPPAPAAASPG